MNARIIEEGELIRDGDNPDLEADFADFADSIRQDQAAEGYVKVWKLPLDAEGSPRSNSGQQALLATWPLGTMTIDDICDKLRKKFMRPGELRMTVCLRGYQRGRSGIRFQKFFTLERENEEAPSAPGSNTTSDVAAMLRLIQQSNEASAARTESFMREMMGLMSARGQQQQVPTLPIDPVGMMGQVAAMMGIFQQMFTGMKPAIAPGEAVDPMKNFVTQLETMKRVQTLLGNDKAPADEGALGIIKAVGPLAKPVLEMMAAQAQRNPMRRKQLAKPGTAAPKAAPAQPVTAAAPVSAAPTVEVAAAVSTEPQGESGMSMARLANELNTLCDMAQRGDDPGIAAQIVLDNLPEEFDDQLGALVSEPSSYAGKLKLLCPRTAQFPAWFETLRVSLAAAYEPDDEAGEDDEDDEDEDDDGDGEFDAEEG